jgi:hypothetical protein
LSVDRVMQGYTRALRRFPLQAPSDDQPLSLPWNTLRWTRSGEPLAEVELRLELCANDGTAWLRYDIDHVSQKTGPQDYTVSMVTTPCRFGGQRWWWICPATYKRVAKLYLPNGGDRFLSRGRGAYRLGYASQRQGPTSRMHDRSRKLYARLGADYRGLAYGFPPKPEGMHWRTYETICGRLEAESDGLGKGLAQLVERLTRSG